MAIKHHLINILNNGNMATSLVSNTFHISGDTKGSLYMVQGFSIQATWAGTGINGILEIEVSIDGTNWVPITNSQIPITTDGTFIWNVEFPFYKYARMKYTRIAGTGTLNILTLVLGHIS